MAAVSWTIQENYLSCADLFPVQSCSSTVCDELLPFYLVGFFCVCCRCSDSRQAGDPTGLCSSSLPVCTHTCGQKHVYIYTDCLCVHKATQGCLPDVSSSGIIPVGRSLERRVLPASAVSLTLGLKCRRMMWPEGHTGWAVTCPPSKGSLHTELDMCSSLVLWKMHFEAIQQQIPVSHPLQMTPMCAL